MSSAPPLFYVNDLKVQFGATPLFSNLSFQVNPQDKICLVGKNGSGKSTLFKVIAGEIEHDDGEYFVQPGTTIGYLPQNIPEEQQISLYDYVIQGLELPAGMEASAFYYQADKILVPLGLDGEQKMQSLSGGQFRRVALAKALVHEPDILLLDEPTNHLDLAGIEWLEHKVKTYPGAVIIISHDREFLRNTSRKTLWLDRGEIRTNNKGYSDYERWSEEIFDLETRQLANMGRKLQAEEGWMQGGISARRKRNQRRVAELKQLREQLRQDKAKLRQATNKASLPPLSADLSSKLVFELNQASKSFETDDGDKKVILDEFSTRIMRGDKIGIIGNNGTGKTTFLDILTGHTEQDAGRVRRAKNAEIRYIDQHRSSLDPSKSLIDILCPHGGDYVTVNNHQMHVIGYLKQFLFTRDDAISKVSTLSGGQLNRLILAKQLADPGNVLILDEPTNDLDMDTLDLLEELPNDYKGTLIVVSHDRDFIDRVVTRTLVFEGDGMVQGYIGGYSDYLQAKHTPPKSTKGASSSSKDQASSQAQSKPSTAQKQKLSYKFKRELELLPDQIEILGKEIKDTESALSNPLLYSEDPEQFDRLSVELVEKQHALAKAEERWLELEEMRMEIEG